MEQFFTEKKENYKKQGKSVPNNCVPSYKVHSHLEDDKRMTEFFEKGRVVLVKITDKKTGDVINSFRP